MINFFRQIRYNLMETGKAGKYFKYALGEIILVVIGILIALQINNWNEAKKAMVSEHQLFDKILKDIKENDKFISDAISQLKDLEDFHYHLFELMNGKSHYNPDMAYGKLRSGIYFDPFFKGNYQVVTQKISNDSVNKMLNMYFQKEDNAIEAIKQFKDIKAKMVRPYLTKNNLNKAASVYTEERYKREDTKKTIDFEALLTHLNEPEFDQILFELKVKIATAIQALESYQNQGRELKAVLKAVLKMN